MTRNQAIESVAKGMEATFKAWLPNRSDETIRIVAEMVVRTIDEELTKAMHEPAAKEQQ